MAAKVHALGFSGSLRKGSFNAAVLRAAVEMAPPELEIETFDLHGIPLYDGDLEAQGMPEPVRRFRERIKAADALLIITPEYNYSMPGVIKNAIDWASRPPEQPFAGKPVAIAGASAGFFGTARAQYHLRQTCVFLDMLPLNKPEVFIGGASTKVDAAGRLTDESARASLRALLEALVAWARKVARG
jgi:chromate reductase, NAD(P)H dehydrogenase (quinone)